MKKTTISLTAEQHESFRRLAFERRTSMSKLIRDIAIEVLEDAEDIDEGMKALADTEGTVTWKQCSRARKARMGAG